MNAKTKTGRLASVECRSVVASRLPRHPSASPPHGSDVPNAKDRTTATSAATKTRASALARFRASRVRWNERGRTATAAPRTQTRRVSRAFARIPESPSSVRRR